MSVLELEPEPEQPCCDYRDHATGECYCVHHERSDLHPFGWPRRDAWRHGPSS